MVHFSSVSSSSSSRHIFRSWGILCRKTLIIKVCLGVGSSCVYAMGVSESAQITSKESTNHASQGRKYTSTGKDSITSPHSLCIKWTDTLFLSIWVIFSADPFLNSFHAHICRQLDESSLALNWAHCRPVSLICIRMIVWPLNFLWESWPSFRSRLHSFILSSPCCFFPFLT